MEDITKYTKLGNIIRFELEQLRQKNKLVEICKILSYINIIAGIRVKDVKKAECGIKMFQSIFRKKQEVTALLKKCDTLNIPLRQEWRDDNYAHEVVRQALAKIEPLDGDDENLKERKKRQEFFIYLYMYQNSQPNEPQSVECKQEEHATYTPGKFAECYARAAKDAQSTDWWIYTGGVLAGIEAVSGAAALFLDFIPLTDPLFLTVYIVSMLIGLVAGYYIGNYNEDSHKEGVKKLCLMRCFDHDFREIGLEKAQRLQRKELLSVKQEKSLVIGTAFVPGVSAVGVFGFPLALYSIANLTLLIAGEEAFLAITLGGLATIGTGGIALGVIVGALAIAGIGYFTYQTFTKARDAELVLDGEQIVANAKKNASVAHAGGENDNGEAQATMNWPRLNAIFGRCSPISA